MAADRAHPFPVKHGRLIEVVQSHNVDPSLAHFYVKHITIDHIT